MTEIKCRVLEDGRVAVETIDKHNYTVLELKNVYSNLKLTKEHKKTQMAKWKEEMAKGKVAIKNLEDDIETSIKDINTFELNMKKIGYFDKLKEEVVEKAKEDKSVG